MNQPRFEKVGKQVAKVETDGKVERVEMIHLGTAILIGHTLSVWGRESFTWIIPKDLQGGGPHFLGKNTSLRRTRRPNVA